MNVTFTKTCIISLMCSNLFVLFLILKLSGDIHPNPGPQSDSLLSSNISTVFPHNLNILHLNIQSILPKMDLLEAEVQNYDILVFTETWLSPQISNDDLLLENFDPPYRQDRHARVSGGVAIYIASGIPSCKRNNIIQGDIEGICIEVSIQSHRFLLCGMYRPPNSGSDYWDLIEQTFDNLCDSHITDLVILGDSNSDLLKPMHANRIQNLTNSYNLHQLIDEPIHYTENSSSLLDLAIISKPENVVYSGVSSPFIPDLIRYHCPIIVTLKF